MDLNVLFTLELLGVVVLVVLVVAGAVYVAVANRRGGRAPESEGPPPRLTDTEAGPPRREFYKSMGLEANEDMKVRLYSLKEYESELGGDASVIEPGHFVAALKAYRWLDDEWYDYSPNKAADVLELTPEDYEVDGEHRALLLRRLPPGMPTSAGDAL